MHANHESKKHMQQRIMVKPAKWHVCSSVMFQINLNGSSDFKWIILPQLEWAKILSMLKCNFFFSIFILGAVWQRIFLSYKELNQLISSHSMDSHCFNSHQWNHEQNSMLYVKHQPILKRVVWFWISFAGFHFHESTTTMKHTLSDLCIHKEQIIENSKRKLTLNRGKRTQDSQTRLKTHTN